MKQILLTTFLVITVGVNCIEFDAKICDSLPQFDGRLRERIANISTDVQKIIDYVVNGADRGVTYNELAKFVDTFGSRLVGTKNLENAIDYMLDLLKTEGHDNVHGEPCAVPVWTRGKEWAQMNSPRVKPLNILGLGYSVGTNGTVLTGEVVVVKTFDELKNRSNEVKGKFVVYNFDFKGYGESVEYRGRGASEAAKYGAIAALVRSVTPLSINSPHTGMQSYASGVVKIPAVSITVEDAELFGRLAARGVKVNVSLYMEARMEAEGTSRNTVSEIKGTDKPDEVVLVSGHLDSWDVGQGAMDDGGGAFISWRALSVIKKLGLKPKRTLRSVLWTGEEMGLIGVQNYAKEHASELSKMSIAMESDIGTFTPFGISFSGTNTTAQCIVNEVLKALNPINATHMSLGKDGSDIDFLMAAGVPGSSLDNRHETYFYYHHSNGDTMTVEDSHQLDLCTAVWAATSYAFAALDDMLPR
ncbi:unnamed protein product [Medioppia subpectinata]|uniref:Carboxypeptidase Q n=1 Tax=Medioppia subpectinata TaxID=1979941 RepID=A0A7R9KKA9_9ACAR|nr:unnamed protein product [Medioppia subpectinata]CAG2105142.1 unnamed protein product [Medioppia subpectinata]